MGRRRGGTSGIPRPLPQTARRKAPPSRPGEPNLRTEHLSTSTHQNESLGLTHGPVRASLLPVMCSCAKSSAHLRLIAILMLDAASLPLLHRLGALPFLATPGPSPAAWWLWLQRTAAQDAVASALRLIATGCAWWLLAPTVPSLF